VKHKQLDFGFSLIACGQMLHILGYVSRRPHSI